MCVWWGGGGGCSVHHHKSWSSRAKSSSHFHISLIVISRGGMGWRGGGGDSHISFVSTILYLTPWSKVRVRETQRERERETERERERKEEYGIFFSDAVFLSFCLMSSDAKEHNLLETICKVSLS